jgi:hypothetical protein
MLAGMLAVIAVVALSELLIHYLKKEYLRKLEEERERLRQLEEKERLRQRKELWDERWCNVSQFFDSAVSNKMVHAVGGAAVVGAVTVPVALPFLGFTSAGVVGSSIAVSAQSYFYGANTCGVFSVLQSAGTGKAMTLIPLMAGNGGVCGVLGGVWSRFRGENRRV